MILEYLDWRFEVDIEATRKKTQDNATDHCMCAYCRNFYETVDMAHPGLKEVLDEFGVCLMGPSELLPFEPTLVLACYRVQGRILSWGNATLLGGDVLLQPEAADEHSFYLWAGGMDLPWVQEEAPEEVPSAEVQYLKEIAETLKQQGSSTTVKNTENVKDR